MNKYKKLIVNTITFALGTFGSKLMVFLLIPIYTGVLAPAELGTADNIIQSAYLLIPLAGLSINEAVLRFALDRDSNKADVFSTGLIVNFIGLSLLLCVFPLLLFVRIIADHLVLLYVYVFIGTFKAIASNFIRGMGYVKLFAFDGIMNTALMSFFTIFFLLVLNSGIEGYISAIILADCISILFLFKIADLGKYVKWRRIDKTLSRAMVAYSIPMIPTAIMWWITNASDRFMITYMKGEAANGLYNTASKLPYIITILAGLFSQAWQISAVAEEESASRNRFYERVFDFYQTLIFVGSAGLLLFIKPLMKILLRGNFNYFDGYIYAPFLIMSTVFSAFVSFFGSIYVTQKKSNRALVTMSIGGILNVLLNFCFIPILGPMGAALATFISYAVVFPIRVIDTRKYVKFRISWGKILINTGTLLAMSLIIIIGPRFMWAYLTILFIIAIITNAKVGLRALFTLIDGFKKKRIGQE